MNNYHIVLTVHDEVVAEVPDTDDYSIVELLDLITDAPQWARDIGLPLPAAGFESYYYKKE